MEIAQAHQVLLFFLAMLIIGTAIKDTTTGRMPLNIRTTTGLSRKFVNIMAMSRIVMNEGSTDPRVATTLPFTP